MQHEQEEKYNFIENGNRKSIKFACNKSRKEKYNFIENGNRKSTTFTDKRSEKGQYRRRKSPWFT